MEKKQKSILVIDDDARNIFALSLVLRSRGYTLHTAGDAIGGIQTLRGHADIGIVLLDMMMPDMDGYQALELIRKDEQLKIYPVISVTAQAMPGDREKCLQAGASDYISKPVNMEELQLILDRYL